MKVGRLILIAAIAASACRESGGPVASDPVAEETATGPVASATACPCWDEARLVTAFPAAHFYRDADGVISLNRFDHENAQQIQALVSIAPTGEGSCELASFGTSGRVEALAAVQGLTTSQCETCSSLLGGLALRAGLVTAPDAVTEPVVNPVE